MLSTPIDAKVDDLIPTNPRQMLFELIDRFYFANNRQLPNLILASDPFRHLLADDEEFQRYLTIEAGNDLMFKDRITFADVTVSFTLKASFPLIIAT